MRKLRPREVAQVCTGTQLGIRVSGDPCCSPAVTLSATPPSYPSPLPHISAPPSPSPVPIRCHTQEKGSQRDSSVLPTFSEIGIQTKKMPLKLVRVAKSCSLFLETFLFSATVRQERGGMGDGCRNIYKVGWSRTRPSRLLIQSMFTEHLLGTLGIMPWASWGTLLPAQRFSSKFTALFSCKNHWP